MTKPNSQRVLATRRRALIAGALVASALVAGVAYASALRSVPIFTRPASPNSGAHPAARAHHASRPARLSPAAFRLALDTVRAKVAPPAGNTPSPPNPPSPPPPLRSFTTWTTPQSGVSLVFLGSSEIAVNGAQDYAGFNSGGGMFTAIIGGLPQGSYYMLDCSADVESGAGNWGPSGSISISVFEGPPQVVPLTDGHLLFAFQGAPDLAVHFWVDPTASPGETGWTYYGCDLHSVN